jgi:hypothetical protein
VSLHATFLAAASAVAGVASTLEQRDTLACTWRENLRRLDEHEYHIRAYRSAPWSRPKPKWTGSAWPTRNHLTIGGRDGID